MEVGEELAGCQEAEEASAIEGEEVKEEVQGEGALVEVEGEAEVVIPISLGHFVGVDHSSRQAWRFRELQFYDGTKYHWQSMLVLDSVVQFNICNAREQLALEFYSSRNLALQDYFINIQWSLGDLEKPTPHKNSP